MRPAWLACAFLACGGPPKAEVIEPTSVAQPDLAREKWFAPAYGKAELGRALSTERGAEAIAERTLSELEAAPASDERARTVRADLAVRRRFIAALEVCEASGRACPPRLDDPPWSFELDADVQTTPKLDAPVRFDLESWRVLTGELHGRACACRTISCVDSMEVAIAQLEVRPMPEVQDDEAASQSVVWARECLARLRGRTPTPRPRAE